MTEWKSFGVGCKNPECNSAIILGDCATRPQKGGDHISFPVFQGGKLTRRNCGREYEYSPRDLREFPLLIGDHGML